MTVRPKRRLIKELAEKLVFLADNQEARLIHGHRTATALAKQARIAKTSLMDMKNGKSNGGISDGHESGLAGVCGFKVNWPEWRTGSADEFRRCYLREVKAGFAVCKERRTGIPLTACPGPTEASDRDVAAMQMFVVASNTGESWPLKIDLICGAPYDFAIKTGHLELLLGEARANKEERLGYIEDHRLADTSVTIRALGDEQEPRWRIETETGYLQRVIPELPYCIVRGLAPGDKITGIFRVYVKDLKSTVQYICQADGSPLGKARKAILQRIATMDLKGGQEGWAVLARQAISFEDACAAQHVDGAAEKLGG